MTAWYNTTEFYVIIGAVGLVVVLVILCAIVSLVAIILVLLYFFCKKSGGERRAVQEVVDERSIETTPLLNNRFDQGHRASKKQMLEARMFLEGSQYKFDRPVFYIGRKHKQYYMVRHETGGKERYLMCITDEYKAEKSILNSRFTSSINRETEKTAFCKWMRSLDHPRITRTRAIHYNTVKKRLITVRDLHPRGSLADFVKGQIPIEDEFEKSQYPHHSLVEETVRRFGRHILEGVYALSKIGLRYPQLSMRNTLVVKYPDGEFGCLLSDLENCFLGIPPHYMKLFHLRKHTGVPLEVLAFGKLMYILSTGNDLPPRTKFDEVESQQLKIILRSIFINPKPEQTTLKYLLDDPYFSSLVDKNKQKKIHIKKELRKELRRVFKKINTTYSEELDPQLKNIL